MDPVQTEVITVLLERIFSKGLLSKVTYQSAVNLVHSDMDFPALLRYPVFQKEAPPHGCAENPK